MAWRKGRKADSVLDLKQALPENRDADAIKSAAGLQVVRSESSGATANASARPPIFFELCVYCAKIKMRDRMKDNKNRTLNRLRNGRRGMSRRLA